MIKRTNCTRHKYARGIRCKYIMTSKYFWGKLLKVIWEVCTKKNRERNFTSPIFGGAKMEQLNRLQLNKSEVLFLIQVRSLTALPYSLSPLYLIRHALKYFRH